MLLLAPFLDKLSLKSGNKCSDNLKKLQFHIFKVSNISSQDDMTFILKEK